MDIGNAQNIYYNAPKTTNIHEKTWQFTTSYKDDGSKVAELKQQISQKMIIDPTTSNTSQISLVVRRCFNQESIIRVLSSTVW